jgi:hypothetical protein
VGSRIQITHIDTAPSEDPWARIEKVGGRGPGGAVWELSQEQAIERIEDGTYSFYVGDGDDSIEIVIASLAGQRYLKTDGDGDDPDRLLALGDLP